MSYFTIDTGPLTRRLSLTPSDRRPRHMDQFNCQSKERPKQIRRSLLVPVKIANDGGPLGQSSSFFGFARSKTNVAFRSVQSTSAATISQIIVGRGAVGTSAATPTAFVSHKTTSNGTSPTVKQSSDKSTTTVRNQFLFDQPTKNDGNIWNVGELAMQKQNGKNDASLPEFTRSATFTTSGGKSTSQIGHQQRLHSTKVSNSNDEQQVQFGSKSKTFVVDQPTSSRKAMAVGGVRSGLSKSADASGSSKAKSVGNQRVETLHSFFDKLNSPKDSLQLPVFSTNGPHVFQAICKVKDSTGFDCYGFLCSLPLSPLDGDCCNGLMTLPNVHYLKLIEKQKKPYKMSIHFENSFRAEKPIEICFQRWIMSKSLGIGFFQLPNEANEYVMYRKLEFLSPYRGSLVPKQRVMALQTIRKLTGRHQPQCVIGDVADVDDDGYFKHRVSSHGGWPILDPLTFTVIGIQKGSDIGGNEIAVLLKNVLVDMAPSTPENWHQSVPDKQLNTIGLGLPSLNGRPNGKNEETHKETHHPVDSSKIRFIRENELELIRRSSAISSVLKEEICDSIRKYCLSAADLSRKTEAEIRLLFPRSDLQEAVFIWKRSIQIDYWRKEQLPSEAARLHSAVKNGDLGSVKSILFSHAIPPGCRPLLVEHRDESNWDNTALLQASIRGYLGIVKFLVRDCNANVYARDSHELQSTAAHLASAYGHLDTLSYLLDHFRELVEVKNKNGDTPLNRAAARGRLSVVQYLVDKKFANIENRGELGRTPLMMASAWGHAHVVEFLRQRGAEVSVRDSETASTALHLAAYFGHAAVVSHLVERHPDLAHVKNKFGKTPWTRAKEEQKKNVMNVLRAKCNAFE